MWLCGIRNPQASIKDVRCNITNMYSILLQCNEFHILLHFIITNIFFRVRFLNQSAEATIIRLFISFINQLQT